MNTSNTLSLPLYRLAHGRTGDKGNRSNISVIAYHPLLWPVIEAQVTAERVAAHFAARSPSNVARHVLPRLQALNFVIDDVLEGGVNSALNLDTHGKALAFDLLLLDIDLPADLLVHCKGPQES
ncbi:hypothetical protein [Acidovorax sp. CCYZU-2555]|uniref:AtuA-related protein n=1 Tax=Acidovorax sp. CCYZU-2555 TaxID=2835042 RepID=UPI001BCEFD37|nr:hypothetical protein [Acidovorax sp. CCYZU-2555]MBS7778200.1 hypothetical protein [Acidovorax sp. CCYZU-2555]